MFYTSNSFFNLSLNSFIISYSFITCFLLLSSFLHNTFLIYIYLKHPLWHINLSNKKSLTYQLYILFFNQFANLSFILYTSFSPNSFNLLIIDLFLKALEGISKVSNTYFIILSYIVNFSTNQMFLLIPSLLYLIHF